jgi:excisionase family DNA binding protein
MAAKPRNGRLEGPLRSLPDAANWLGVSLQHLRNEMEGGSILTVRVGRRKMIPASELDRYINANVAEVKAKKVAS